MRPTLNPSPLLNHKVFEDYIAAAKPNSADHRARICLVNLIGHDQNLTIDLDNVRGRVPVTFANMRGHLTIDGRQNRGLEKLKELPKIEFTGSITLKNMPNIKDINNVRGIAQVEPDAQNNSNDQAALNLSNNKSLSSVDVSNVDLDIKACDKLDSIRTTCSKSHKARIEECKNLKSFKASGEGVNQVELNKCKHLTDVDFENTSIETITVHNGLHKENSIGTQDRPLKGSFRSHFCPQLKNIGVTGDKKLDVSIINAKYFENLKIHGTNVARQFFVEGCAKVKSLFDGIEEIEKSLTLINVGSHLNLRRVRQVGEDALIEKSTIEYMADGIAFNKNLTLDHCKPFQLPDNLHVEGDLSVPGTKILSSQDQNLSVGGKVKDLSLSERVKALRGKSQLVNRSAEFKWLSNPKKWQNELGKPDWDPQGVSRAAVNAEGSNNNNVHNMREQPLPVEQPAAGLEFGDGRNTLSNNAAAPISNSDGQRQLGVVGDGIGHVEEGMREQESEVVRENTVSNTNPPTHINSRAGGDNSQINIELDDVFDEEQKKFNESL